MELLDEGKDPVAAEPLYVFLSLAGHPDAHEEARFLAAVEKGIAAAERGEFIEEDEMDARLEAMFKT